MRKPISRLFILVIDVYRKLISPLSPPTCRFHPSCSEYTRAAIIRFGPIKGSWLGLKRLLKCHPWHPGGYDPI